MQSGARYQAVLDLITTIFERRILISFNISATREHYISSTFLAIVLFIYFLIYKRESKLKSFIARIGRDYSTLIYIIHPVIIEILDRLMCNNSIYNKLYPIIIFIITCLICMLYKKINVKLKGITSI